jgi:trimethylamine:corrinoid methyltransferase-like protein
MLGFDRVDIKGNYLSPLTEIEVEQIHASACRILGQTGIAIFDKEVLALLDEAGCPIDRESRRAFIQEFVINEALSKAPLEIALYNRLGQKAMKLGSGAFYARISSGATGILDTNTGLRRDPTTVDAVDVIRLADALPHIHGVSTMAVQPSDVSVKIIDLEMMKLALANTIKPLGYV